MKTRTYVTGPDGTVYDCEYDEDAKRPQWDPMPPFDAALKTSAWNSGIDEGGSGCAGPGVVWKRLDSEEG
jgi:hypothetical protein